MKRDTSYLMEILSHVLGLVGMVWILAHLIMLTVWGEVRVIERFPWILYSEVLVIGFACVVLTQRLFSHSKGFMLSELSLGKDILRKAVANERNGMVFYQTMADTTVNDGARDMFARLAVEERAHEELFRKMLVGLGEDRSDYGYVGEYYRSMYVKDLMASSSFTGEKARNSLDKQLTSESEALEIAIGMEKDAILLFAEMRGRVPRRTLKTVEMVLDQEKKHLKWLLSRLGQTTSKETEMTTSPPGAG